MHLANKTKNFLSTAVHLVKEPAHAQLWFRQRKAPTLELRQPWWPYAMVEHVDKILPSNARVFEYGGGGSSLWFFDRRATLTVVEHNPDWCRALEECLPKSVTVLNVPPTEAGKIESSSMPGYFDDYVNSIGAFDNEWFDIVVVDGRCRVDCVNVARQKVRRGGWIVLDDSNRPRYQDAHRILSAWPATTLKGLKVGSNSPATTTIWTRP